MQAKSTISNLFFEEKEWDAKLRTTETVASTRLPYSTVSFQSGKRPVKSLKTAAKSAAYPSPCTSRPLKRKNRSIAGTEEATTEAASLTKKPKRYSRAQKKILKMMAARIKESLKYTGMLTPRLIASRKNTTINANMKI